MVSRNTKKLVYCSLIAATYAALTMLLHPISYGAIQLRVSEALCILPFFFSPSAWALFVGCAIANILSSAGVLDVAVGSIATLLAGLCTAAIGRKYRKKTNVGKISEKPGWGWCIAACAMPVIFNGPFVGAELAYLFPLEGGFRTSFLLFGAQVAVGEAIVMFGLALPLMRFILKNERAYDFFYALN